MRPVTSTDPGAAPDISVIVNGHREGSVSQPTLAALARAVRVALEAGLTVEVVGVLDRADHATTAAFGNALAQDGVVGRMARTRIVTTDLGDPGAARNEGVRHTRGAWVCVLDGDNLPSGTWLRDAHRTASAHGAPCVVHPEQLVIFGERWQVWPQLPTDHPGFRPHNFFDRTYWDTFCLASREVFTTVPYAATAAGRGLGPEDWHWGMETFHAGFPHVVAPGTALLYRDKPGGSVQGGHAEAHSLLPPTALLTDPHLAAEVPPDRHHPDWRGLQLAIVSDHADVQGPTVPSSPGRTGLRGRLRRARPVDDAPPLISDPHFNVLHYQALHAEVLRLSRDDAIAHFADIGRPAGLRAALSQAELRDVAALDLEDYSALHPDLAGLDADALLHHYLAHGRAEGRAISTTPEEREASLPVSIGDRLVAELSALRDLEPAIPAPTRENLDSLRRVGPPSDGSVTRGSRAWWRVVEAIGPPPQVIVFVSRLPSTDSRVDARCAAVLAESPRRRVAVVSTGEGSTRPPGMDRGVAWLDLSAIDEWRQLAEPERRRLLATLVVQHRPEVVHALGSAEFAPALDHYGVALRASTRLEMLGYTAD